MEYRVLDLTNDPRKAHFAYFNSLANPYVGVTVEVDITDFMAARRAAGAPFFLSFLYCVTRAANAVPQLRRRILEGKTIEFDRCITSHTLLRADGSYCYCPVDCDGPFRDYLPAALQAQERAMAAASLEDGEEGIRLFFVSSMPWLHYTDFTQPTPTPADSNPRISWGKYLTREGRTTLPVTLLAHHALVDGLHLGAFYEALDRALADFAEEVAG